MLVIGDFTDIAEVGVVLDCGIAWLTAARLLRAHGGRGYPAPGDGDGGSANVETQAILYLTKAR